MLLINGDLMDSKLTNWILGGLTLASAYLTSCNIIKQTIHENIEINKTYFEPDKKANYSFLFEDLDSNSSEIKDLLLTEKLSKFKSNEETYPYLPFVDTEKPNAIVVLPFEDAAGAFRNNDEYNFNENLNKYYDVARKVVKSSNDIDSLIKNIPDVKLLVLSSHEKDSIMVFDSDTKNGYLSLKSEWLKDGLSRLDSNAVIFLNSCSSGKYGLTDYVKDNALPNQTVFGANEPFSSTDMDVIKYYPFDIKIILFSNLYSNNDITWKK